MRDGQKSRQQARGCRVEALHALSALPRANNGRPALARYFRAGTDATQACGASAAAAIHATTSRTAPLRCTIAYGRRLTRRWRSSSSADAHERHVCQYINNVRCVEAHGAAQHRAVANNNVTNAQPLAICRVQSQGPADKLCTTTRRTDVTDAETPLTWSLPLPSEDVKTNGYDAANAAIAACCEAFQPRPS